MSKVTKPKAGVKHIKHDKIIFCTPDFNKGLNKLLRELNENNNNTTKRKEH